MEEVMHQERGGLMPREAMRVEGLTAFYGPVPAVRNVSFSLSLGKTLGLIGPNGAGKSSLLKAIAGLVRASGTVALNGQEIQHLPTGMRYQVGLGFVPQERMVIGGLTVRENLRLSWLAGRRLLQFEERLERVLGLFPQLQSRLNIAAASLSGGQRQMLAISRGLALDAQVLLLDEPTAGLAPVLVGELITTMVKLRDQGLTMMVAEQNFRVATQLCEEVLVVAGGEAVWRGNASGLERKTAIELYLGREAFGKN